MIKSFRGKLDHGKVETINLHTNDGKIGYRIVKFQLMPVDANENTEHVLKVYSTIPEPFTATDVVDFSDQTLLAVGMYWSSTSVTAVHESVVVFDSVIFNQDIFVTCDDEASSRPMNYHIELEQMSLDLNEATVATLQSIRSDRQFA